MTKIILAFPCMGKTYYAQNHPDKDIDLESSDYFFDRTGYEHLSSEEFKGIENRKPNPNGLKDYLSAIKKKMLKVENINIYLQANNQMSLRELWIWVTMSIMLNLIQQMILRKNS